MWFIATVLGSAGLDQLIPNLFFESTGISCTFSLPMKYDSNSNR